MSGSPLHIRLRNLAAAVSTKFGDPETMGKTLCAIAGEVREVEADLAHLRHLYRETPLDWLIEGMKARRNGLGVECCPYGKGCGAPRSRWLQGWRCAVELTREDAPE